MTDFGVAHPSVWLSDGAHSGRLVPLGIPLTADAADSNSGRLVLNT